MDRDSTNLLDGRSGLRIALAALAMSMIFVASVMPTTAEAGPYTAGHKFRRGVSNMTLGVLAIPGQMTHLSKEKGYAIGLPLGFVQGVGFMVVTEVVGVWEFLTCPFEFPREFRPIISPEYPWHYFKRRSRGAGFGRKQYGGPDPGRKRIRR